MKFLLQLVITAVTSLSVITATVATTCPEGQYPAPHCKPGGSGTPCTDYCLTTGIPNKDDTCNGCCTSDSCSVCVGGKADDGTNRETCSSGSGDKRLLTGNSCVAGTSMIAGATTCTTCPAGSYSSAGATSCTSCPPNTFSGSQASSCTACPVNSYSRRGAASCSPCATTIPASITGAPYITYQCGNFYINGQITNSGKSSTKGLLMNMRMIQGVFDYVSTATSGGVTSTTTPTAPNIAYPASLANADTCGGNNCPAKAAIQSWTAASAQRNTDEFIANMKGWAASGVNAFTIGVMGGSVKSGWHYTTNAFTCPSTCTTTSCICTWNAATLSRLATIITASSATTPPMVPIVSLFYNSHLSLLGPGASPKGAPLASVTSLISGFITWAVSKNFVQSIIVEVINECAMTSPIDPAGYSLDCASLGPYLTMLRSAGFLVGNSNGGSTYPTPSSFANMDIALLHGNLLTLDQLLDMVTSVCGGTSSTCPRSPTSASTILTCASCAINLPIVFNEGIAPSCLSGDSYCIPAAGTTAVYSLVKSTPRVASGFYQQGIMKMNTGTPSVTTGYSSGFQTPPINWSFTSRSSATGCKDVSDLPLCQFYTELTGLP